MKALQVPITENKTSVLAVTTEAGRRYSMKKVFTGDKSLNVEQNHNYYNDRIWLTYVTKS